MLKAQVSRVGVNEKTNTPVIILDVEEGGGMLPIAIGKREAKAIALALQDVKLPRPISYDLMKSILEQLGAYLERVRITALRAGTFYAEIDLLAEGRKMAIDSRPSDAIALALRMDAPIFIEENVVKQAVIHDSTAEFTSASDDGDGEAQNKVDEEREKFREFLENVRPEDFGNPDEVD